MKASRQALKCRTKRCLPSRPDILFNDLSKFGKYLGQAAKMMVGLPDYETYVAHLRTTHPDLPVMTEIEFFRDRQEARYGSGRSGGCC